MENKKPSSRKKFILGVGVMSVLGVFLRPFQSRKDIISCGQPEKKAKLMLTEDGRLVEIEEENILANTGKISDKDLQSWIKKS